jgi:hypothetical protein
MGGVIIRKTWPFMLASVPLWPILWLLAFAGLARVELGYWPSYDHPDPSSLKWPWSILDIGVLPLLVLAPLAVLGSLAASVHAWYVSRWDWRLLLTAACFVVLLAWLQFDPGGFFAWWLD